MLDAVLSNGHHYNTFKTQAFSGLFHIMSLKLEPGVNQVIGNATTQYGRHDIRILFIPPTPTQVKISNMFSFESRRQFRVVANCVYTTAVNPTRLDSLVRLASVV